LKNIYLLKKRRENNNKNNKMYKKLICAIVLIAFVSVQLVNSLKCYECNGTNCNSPSTINCDGNSANRTVLTLASYFPSINRNTSMNYECLNSNGTSNNNWVRVRGCVYRETNACAPFLAGTNQNNRFCYTCTKDLCNPAGTFSSSIYTIGVSLIALLVAKFLA